MNFNRKIYMRHYRELQRLKERARMLCQLAVKEGIMKRGRCEACDSEATEGHHWDYERPFYVTWLCRQCHTKVHALARRLRDKEKLGQFEIECLIKPVLATPHFKKLYERYTKLPRSNR